MVSVKWLEDKSFRAKNGKSKLLERSCSLLQGMHFPIYCFGSQSLEEDTSFDDISCIAEEEQSMLEAVLLSQWEDRMLKDYFKYDVTTSEIKVITGNMKFLSQLNEGQITDHQSKSEGNTLHEFSPLVFDCMKHPEELLFCLASSKKAKSELTASASVPDSAVLVVINVTPVEYGHVYLVPCASNKLYSFLDARSIETSTRLAAEINNQSLRVFYDCYRPNCSAVYFEACYLPHPLPVEFRPQTCAASRAISAWECGGYFLFADRNLRNFLLHDMWLYIDKQEEERNYLALRVDILFEIALLCQKKDSYTDSVYSKNTFGTILTISQRLSFPWLID